MRMSTIYILIAELVKSQTFKSESPPKKLAGTAIYLSGSQSYDLLTFQNYLNTVNYLYTFFRIYRKEWSYLFETIYFNYSCMHVLNDFCVLTSKFRKKKLGRIQKGLIDFEKNNCEKIKIIYDENYCFKYKDNLSLNYFF
ncbi:hypothetical protein BpHYR1_043813 [Brachionus plicatilis]|uniref:Uncharacterized protein n=1 Tax=Brachionus plicatilis TaxID=10195 RepID=A0A3M7RX19_BRAPC|nr:hypothetical protein BpHYR1_043813 [Brachionus plicatilis]